MPEEQNAIGKLEHELSVLQREHKSIVASIHELRQEARKESIEAASCRQGVPEAKIKAWRDGIAKLQSELLEVQARIATVNKEQRQARSKEPIKALSQLPRDVAAVKEPAGIKPNGDAVQSPNSLKEGHILFLQFFRQLVTENIDPRLVEVLEKDAHGLVNDYRRMHKEP
jgi:predicted RNase H-like nuclease (RuvC/YqgF family)